MKTVYIVIRNGIHRSWVEGVFERFDEAKYFADLLWENELDHYHSSVVFMARLGEFNTPKRVYEKEGLFGS